MSTSKFCIQQRQQEQQKLKRLLGVGFAGSTLLHGTLAFVFPSWLRESVKTENPIELIIVEQPKPEPKKTKLESKPIPKPEPVKTITPPPPVKTQTPPPKPIPQKILTSPTPAPSQPVVSVPIENTAKTPSLSSNLTGENSSVSARSDSSSISKPGLSGAVATNSAPPRPQPSTARGITCVSNCKPEYPSALEGAEGSARIQLTIDSGGNVTSATVASANSNSQLNRQALLAARQMKFSSPGGGSASVQVTINFTVAGSEFDRTARQQQLDRERAEKEREQQERARQQQLEQERQARQQQLDRERQERARQQQVEQERQAELQRQQLQPRPLPTKPKLESTPSAQEREEEMLRKFRERIESHQQQQ